MIFTSNPKLQFLTYSSQIKKEILATLNSDRYILGNNVENFEKEFSSYIGVKYAIGVANGTDAIELVLRALEIKQGDEVITVSHTALASVAAIQCAGATPIMADISKNTFTINCEILEKLITPKTKAILAVHLYGTACDIKSLKKICSKYKIYLIEDVSQAHGAIYNNKKLGSHGIAGCFSCYPTKNLGAIGDAGVITTNNKKLAIKLSAMRQYGWVKSNISNYFGRNSRLDEIQAAILRVKLKYLDKNNNKRKKIADFYNKNLTDKVIKPTHIEKSNHVYHLYVIKTNYATKLEKYLRDNKIFCGVHYPLPIHCQPSYIGHLKIKHKLVNTENLIGNILSIPIYPELKTTEYKFICSKINQFFKNNVS